MTAEKYQEMAAEFRSRASSVESPAFRAELEDLARCYEWAAGEMMRRPLAQTASSSCR
jgi:hypothetical protein